MKQKIYLRSTYEDARTTLGSGALATQTLDPAVRVHLVVLEDGHLDLLALVLDLLGGLNHHSHVSIKLNDGGSEANVVRLLLALLGTTTKAEHQVEGRFLLDVVVAEGATVFELLAGKDQTLLVGGDTIQP